MTPIQFQQLLKNTKLNLKGKPEDLFQLLSEFAELEYQYFIDKNSQSDAAYQVDDVDISTIPQKEAA